MSEQFKEQGGVATMDPSPLVRWLTSNIMKRLSNPERMEKNRARIEVQRRKSGLAHTVEYFHQLEDGYSHLAVQVLQAFCSRYEVNLVCHLVEGPVGKNVAEPDLLLRLSRYDAFHVAPEYGLVFPGHAKAPKETLVNLAASILAAQDNRGFIGCVAEVSAALWAGEEDALKLLAQRCGSVSAERTAEKIIEGSTRQKMLQHYSGAMFYYGEEWYWGVDRLYHLEKRLSGLGLDSQSDKPMLMPRPAVESGELRDDGSLTLEVYPSLRSPYTAISFDRTVKLAKETGVKLIVRPVLPMVMRGVPATRQKGFYIFKDAAREAREAGIEYGNFYDPIGKPTRQCYSLFPWASEQGRGVELVSSFLNAAFVQGVNTNNNRGLKQVVESAGLDWSEAKTRLGETGWEDLLEANRLAMYEAGLWGVPSFRLLNGQEDTVLALWGQDRLWLIAREIQRQLRPG